MDSKIVLGVKINNITMDDALKKASNFLNVDSEKKQYSIFTPNPEILVRAQSDKYFKNTLNQGDMNICDGFGLSFFANLHRLTGVDFMISLIKMADKNNHSVYLLGSGKDYIVKNTAINLKKTNSTLNILGFNKGPVLHEDKKTNKLSDETLENKNCTKSIIEDINKLSPEILFVAFGMGKQEKWIYENLKKIPSVKIAIGVGGSFDFIANVVKRAPYWMRKLGLEWVYRLIKEPKRIKRILNATIKFLYYLTVSKIKTFKK